MATQVSLTSYFSLKNRKQSGECEGERGLLFNRNRVSGGSGETFWRFVSDNVHILNTAELCTLKKVKLDTMDNRLTGLFSLKPQLREHFPLKKELFLYEKIYN